MPDTTIEKTYIRLTDSTEGPFDSPEAADTYVYDTGWDDSDYQLVSASELRPDEEVEAPEIQLLTVEIQVNGLPSTSNLRHVLEMILDKYNYDSNGGGAFHLLPEEA